MTPQATDDTPLAQDDVLARWPLLSEIGLRAARKTGRIAWIKGKRGKPFYRPTAIKQYITDYLERPTCPDHAKTAYSTSADNGLPMIRQARSFTASGMNPALLDAAALASAQRI